MAIIVTIIAFAAGLAVIYMMLEEKKETIKIGAIISLSGSASHLVDVRDAMLLAAKEINYWGGVNGRKIELIIEDSKTNPEEGKKAFERMERKHHPLLYVSTTSLISMALAPLAEKYKVVLVGVVVATPNLTGQKEWVFKYHTSSEHEAKPILSILQKLKVRKLGILYQNDDFGISVFDVLREEFEKSGGTVKGEPFKVRNPDFKSKTVNLMDTEAIYTVGFVKHDWQAIRQLRADNYKGVILAHSGAASLPRPSPELNGVFVASPVIYNPHYLFAREAKEKYETEYGKTFNHQAANGYDLIKFLADLLEDKDATRESMKSLLEEGFIYSGLFGDIDVKPGDHNMNFPLHPARISGREIKFLQ